MKRILLTLVLLLGVSLVLTAQDDDEMMSELPEEVVIEMAGILPEGVEYDAANERFLTGSLAEGTIFEVMDDGSIAPFIEDEDLISTVGIHVDTEGERLLVTNSNRDAVVGGGDPLAGVAAYDLNSGERLFIADMTGLVEANGAFANDVTVDDEGNAYVTDSFAPAIYVVTPEGDASVFIENEMLSVQGFGLNGIDYHPDGYLLAAVTGSGAIFKIPLAAPEDITQVETEMPISIDGMALDADNNLYAVARVDGEQQIAMIVSEDDWESATIAMSAPTTGAATTLALREDAVYYINAYLNNPEAEQYEIVMAMFDGDMMDMSDDAEEEPIEPAATEEA